MSEKKKMRIFELADKKIFQKKNQMQFEPKDKVNSKTRKQIFRLSQKKE